MMNTFPGKYYNGFLLTIFSILLLSGCGGAIEVASRWKTDNHSPSSAAEEREWALTAIKDVPVLIGFSNDDTCLSIHLIAQNREMARKIVLSGMTIWFDPEGGDAEYIGIHYPIGMHESRDLSEPGVQEHPGSNNRGEGQFEEHRDELLRTSLADVELLGPGKYDRESCPIIHLKGMSINIRDEDQRLIYELMIPMKKDSEHPFAIGPVKSDAVGIRIKTGSENTNRPRPEMGGERPGGGRGEFPDGGGGRGGRGRSPRTGEDRRPESITPLDVAVKVTLAKQPVEMLQR